MVLKGLGSYLEAKIKEEEYKKDLNNTLNYCVSELGINIIKIDFSFILKCVLILLLTIIIAIYLYAKFKKPMITNTQPKTATTHHF